MSNDFWSTLNKKKREELLKSTQTKSSSSDREEIKTGDFWSVLNEDKKRELLGTTTDIAPTRTFMQDDDDIAPVKGGNKNSIFKSGGFSDGVDGVGDFFGDLGQTVGGTVGDLGLGILKGAGRLVEGVVDLGTYGVAGVADLFGADKFAEKTKKVAQYSATDEWTKGATDYLDQYSVLGNKADAVGEGLGQVGAIILTGGLGATPAAASAITTGVTFASGMGSGMGDAYAMGASDGKAAAYGATVGSIEAVSEMIFGGLGKGFKALGVSKGLTSIDDVFAKKLSNAAAKFITSEAGQKVVGNTLEYAVKSGAEGLEEVISGFGSAIAKDAYLMNGEDEKAFGEILKDENLLEQFVVGSIVSGIAQGGDFISSTKNGRDFVSGLSKNEQTVVDKVFEQRLAEESENRTLSNRDKNKLYERVVEEVKRGYVTTDEIESILGGETYKGYKDLTDKQTSLETRKKAIEEEIKSLVKTPESQFTVEQREKLNSLRKEAKGIKESLQNLGIKTAKNNLFNEVDKLTSKDTYLRESYNDLVRQTQDIQIDENQYNGTKFADAAKKTIANARNAGASNSIRVRDFVEFSAKYSSVSGTVVDFKDANQINKILEDQLKAKITTLQKSTTAEDKAKLAKVQEMLKDVQDGKIHVNGVKTKDGVAINIKSPNYLNVVLGHEVTHFLEGKNAYEPLQKAIFKYAQSKGDLDGRRSVLEALYENIDGTSVDYELTADLVGDYLFTEYDFIKNLSTEDRNVFQKVYDQIKYMFKLATAGSKEARELEKVMHQFERALRESAEVSQNTQYQLSKDIDKNADLGYNGNELYTATEDFYLDVDRNDRDAFARSLANKTADLKQDEIRTVEIYSDKKVYFFKATGYMQGRMLKSVSANDYDGFIKARKEYVNEIDGSSETLDTWIEALSAYRKGAGSDISDFGIGQGKNDSDGIYGRASERNGTGTQERSGENFRDDPEEVKSVIAELHKEYGITENYSTNEIAPIKEVSSTDDAFFDGEKKQFSLSTDKKKADADYKFAVENGDTETAQKMVDEAAKNAGYGIKAYHGTGFDFTVFDKSKQGDNYQDWGRLGKGFYFAPTSREAETWAELSKGGKNKVMPVYLRSDNMLDSFEALPDNLKDTIPENWDSLTRRLAEKYAYNYIEYMQEFGYNVQQILTEKGYDGINGHTEFVVFDPEQVKSADVVTYDDEGNAIPLSERFNTANEDIRFSLSKPVEKTKNLFAVHNLKSDELIKTLELGGLPMPSIAVIRAEQGHEKYGDVSLIFPKDTIDPQANKDNKVYGGDAWTPTYPRIEYKANEGVQKKVRDKYYELANKIGYDAVRPLYRYAHELESALNSEQGEANLLDWLYKDTKLMQLYLEDSGKGKVEDIVKETRTEASESDKEMSQWFIDKLGEDLIRAFKPPAGENPLSHRKNYIAEHKAEIASAWEGFCREVYQITEEQIQNVMRDTTGAMYMKFMRNAEQYLNNGGVTIKTETDYDATEKAIEEKAADGYKEWVDGLFKGVQEKTGIRNDEDIFTSRGDRRSWDALHWENTLENVVRAMKAQDQTGADAFSPASAIFAVAHKRYNTIDEVKADSNRLGRVSEDEYKAMEEGYASRLVQIANSIKDTNERNPFIASDEAAQQIIDAVRNYKTKSGMLRYMQKWNSRVTESTVDDILSLVSDIANMPTGYFEAKPQRAVGLEEVGVFVIPNNVDVKLKQELLNKGYNIAEYDPNVEGDRQRVVNQFEEYKFSLADVGESRTLGGSYRFDGKDFRVKSDEDIAPIGDGVVEDATTTSAAVPKSTRVADGTRGDELLAESLDNYPMQTIEQKIAEKIRATEGELTDNRDLRKEADANYESQIAKLRAEYNSKKNKNTKVAYGLLQSISRLERLKASTDAQFAKRISDLEARVEKMKEPKYTRAMRRRAKMAEHAQFAANLLGDTSTWKDKKLGLQYATNTERRNLRDIVRDENGNIDIARADTINDALNGQYNREEADRQRELAQVRKKYADLKITKAEDEYIQMLGELRHNPETELSPQTVNEYLEKHKDKIDEAKVDKVIELARQDYDNFIIRVNEALRAQGMREIPYRQGYFPHFVNPKQNFIQKLFNWKTQDNEIPTSIAGLTEEFKPVKSWQSFDKKRHGDKTDYSFMKGFDAYSNGVLDWIYHLDTIQKRRAVENHIRSTHSDEGITKRIKEVYANEEYDANEAQAQIEQILSEANNPLNNFVQDFMTHTNILTNKKNSLDRTTEQMTNRKIYSVMQNVQNRTSANMVLANVRSALTNFIPITQSWAQVSPLRSLQATKDTIANAIKDDGLINKSTFLTNRLREADNLYKTNWDKVLDKAGIMFEIVDNFSSQVIWRSKYNQNLSNGMSEAEAIANADQFAENVMAGRSKGNEPTLFNAKNPLVKAFTMFQLEVNNQYGYLFKDVPNDLKAETNHWKLNLAKGYTTAFIGAYVYNALLEKVAGSGAALDPIGIIEELLRDLGLFDDDEEKEPDEVVTNLVDNVVEELPFVGGLFGGGRIPISSAIPYGGEYSGGFSQASKDVVSALGAVGDVIKGNGDEADWSGAKNLGKELMNPILNVGLPVGGGQLKKTVQGLKMFSDEHPVTGSYTDSGNLRFPVEDTFGNRLQAGVFGQYASKNAREYFDNDYAPLKEKQIQEYIDVELPIGDYWKYREGLSGLKTNAEKADYVNSLDIADWQKNLLMNNILDRKEDVDMSNYDDYSDWEEFDYAQKNPDKYAFAKSVGGYSAYKTYSDELYDIKADKDEYGKSISGSRKEKVLNYINNLDADYETKIILWKSEYPSDDTYNMDIINHLNNRADLTYEERVTILKELGFTVSGDTVYWD